jgi:hypothetical protein
MLNKPYQVRSKRYLDWIREMPCIVCLILDSTAVGPSEPHHVSNRVHGGVSTKASDYRVVPLCHFHHQQHHNVGKQTFSRQHNINLEEVITNLNRIWEERNEVCDRH